jgi:hypothetical protein
MPVVPYPHCLEMIPYRLGTTANRSWQTTTIQSSTKWGHRFQAEATGTVTNVLIYTGTQAPGSGTVRVGIQTVTASTSLPTGTWVAYGDLSWTNTTHSQTTQNITTTVQGSVTRGESYAWVVEYVTGTPFVLGTFINAIDRNVSQPHQYSWSGSAWSLVGGFQDWDRNVFGYRVNSLWYGHIYSSWGHYGGDNNQYHGAVFTLGGDASLTNATINRVRAIFKGGGITAGGISCRIGSISGSTLTPITTFDIVSNGNLLFSNNNNEWSGWSDLIFPSDVTVPTNTKVFIGFRKQYDVTMFLQSVSDVSHWNWWHKGPLQGSYAYVDASTNAVTEFALQRPWMAVDFTSLTTVSSAGGGGLLTHRGMNGGING